jgi:hypothetical protein
MRNSIRNATIVSGLLAVALVAGFQGTTTAQNWRGFIATNQPLEEAEIFLEFNQSDNDLGVHIETDNNPGLRELRVAAPNGRDVLALTWQDTPPLGLTEMKTETAEPAPAKLLQAYPAGVYRFLARTVDGKLLASVATLSHQLLPAPRITAPAEGAEDVSTDELTVVWDPVPGAVGYFLEIDGPEGKVLETFLPPTTTSLEVSEGLLAEDAEHTLGVAAIHRNGNLSLSERDFETGDD